jgi:hypothetical protein
MSQMGITVASINIKKTILPPNLSVHIPIGKRINDPVRTGIAINKPNWVSFNDNICLIGMPITANIIHIMKQMVKEIVLAVTTDQALNFCEAITIYLPRFPTREVALDYVVSS